MKKVVNRCLALCVVVFAFFSLMGCATQRHITKTQIYENLDYKALYKSFDVQPTDLSLTFTM